MKSMKKYMYTLGEDGPVFGHYDTIEEATEMAFSTAKQEEFPTRCKVTIWNAREATPADDDIFGPDSDDDGGCDTTQPNWWKDRWVPENIVHTAQFEPS